MQTTWTLPVRPARLHAPGDGRAFDYARGRTATRMNEHARLEAAYRATRYRVLAEPAPFALRVDMPSQSLAALMRQHGVTTAAYLTAWNPYSERASEADNRAANDELRAALVDADAFIFDGEGVDPDGAWPAEPSFLALGLAFATASELGRRFKQNAILFADDDAVPRLVWLPRNA